METADSNYGSDRYGLVWGYVLGAGREAAPIDSEGAARWLATAASAEPDRFVWLHFSLANAACRSWLRSNLELPDAFHDELREGTGSTRLERDGDALLAVVHDVLFDFSFDASDVSTVSLCVQPQVMISVRLKPLRSLDRLRASVKAGDGFSSPAGLLAQLLRGQAGVLADILRQATGRVDEIEDKVLTNRISVSRTELGALRRVLVRLQRLLAPEPAALFRLLSRPPAWVGAEDVQDLREAAEEFSVAVADSAALGERVKLLQEELAATVSERTGRTPVRPSRPRWVTSPSGNSGTSLVLPRGRVRFMFGSLGYALPGWGSCAGAVTADSGWAMAHVTVGSRPLGVRPVGRQVAARDHKTGNQSAHECVVR